MFDNPLFESWQKSESAAAFARQLEGRNPFIEPAIVMAIDDPLNRRRVRVTLAKSPETMTDWLDRLIVSPSDDPPLPQLGQTVVVAFYSGDGHHGCYFGALTNDRNVEQKTTTPALDSARVVPGDLLENVEGESKSVIRKDLIFDVGQTVLIKNAAGASLTLTEAGVAIVEDAWGNRIILGGASGGMGLPSDVIAEFQASMTIDLNNHSLSIVDANNVSINGKQVATIGATDSRGDNLTTRGW
jgi:hypothetical protein